jgi:hypothetical protein
MSGRIDLKAAERRAFRSTFQDGLWDMFLGMIFLLFAIGPLLQKAELSKTANMLITLGVNLGSVLIFVLAKRYITTPRIGLVNFGDARKSKVRKGRLVLAASVVLGLVVFILTASGNLSGGEIILGLFSLNILVVFGAMAYYFDFTRLYGYAVGFALSLPVGLLLEEWIEGFEAPYTFFLSAGVPLIIGTVLFVRFLRDYPLPMKERINDTA